MSVTTSGYELKSERRTLRSAVELVSSMRFAIALLVVLAIASIVGRTILTRTTSISSARSGPISSAG